ncbi:9-cis-epoxycarotenoid dioxygenase NCED9, chloroplastic [Symbiodinium microadriaticum]|uniref:9-cis-epoxycarotenoid dioxygenase NCED9, chloroplastic n=1 Tax=Symbiodinium microadriaticum TaxID=2951 RepID=A0A1Q9CPV5_SYMMI|nr:9-cis-epoxycarotenoid dioxygenase NCED9, chloroplastic [Symbiodinium microadriaticum]
MEPLWGAARPVDQGPPRLRESLPAAPKGCWKGPEADRRVACLAVATAAVLRLRGRRISRRGTHPSTDVAVAQLDAAELRQLGRPPAWLREAEEANLQLANGWEPVSSEVTLRNLRIRGHLPQHVQGGIFLRNGPNQAMSPVSMQDYHIFDGHGMIHAVHFLGDEEGATYARRYVRTQALQFEESEGQCLYTGMKKMLPQFPTFFRLLFEKYFGSSGSTDSPYWVIQNRNPANNGCTVHAGRVLATWEAGWAYELRLPDLETLGLFDYEGTWPDGAVTDNCSAHGKQDPETGQLITISYNMIELPPWLRVITASADGALEKSVKVPLPSGAALLHDFGITQRRVILNVGPLNLVPLKMVSGAPPFDFDFSAKCYFGILSRSSDSADDVIWVEAENCFNFHVLNAYDDPTDPARVIVHTFRQDYTLGLGMGSKLNEETRMSPHGRRLQGDTAVLHRWVIDVSAAKVVESTRLHQPPADPRRSWLSDFGAVNPRYVGRPHRYGWSLGFDSEIQAGSPVPEGSVARFTRVLKHDLETGELLERDFLHSAGACVVGAAESRFACNDLVVVPGGGSEDEASLLLLVHDLVEETAELRVLDAATLNLQCAVEIPTRVPLGFHCSFAAAGSFDLGEA